MTKKLREKRRVAPGIWIDADNCTHVSITELLDLFGWPHDEEHIRGVKETVTQLLAKGLSVAEIRFVPRCPNCGAGEGEPHKVICALYP